MFEITAEQEALLRLPDSSTFFPLLCRETTPARWVI